MAQFARPDADISAGTWTPVPASPTTLFDKTDETTPDDADYIQSVVNPANATAEVSLAALTDPLASTGHIMRWRVAKDQAGGSRIDMILRLREGVTTRATLTNTDVSNTFTTFSYTLTGTEADAITDYGNLSYQVEADQV